MLKAIVLAWLAATAAAQKIHPYVYFNLDFLTMLRWYRPSYTFGYTYSYPTSTKCYDHTTTIPSPTCTPFEGVCPLLVCDTATSTATVTVPPNYNALKEGCKMVSTVTEYKGCTTNCAPITCPTKTITKTEGKNRQCCTSS